MKREKKSVTQARAVKPKAAEAPPVELPELEETPEVIAEILQIISRVEIENAMRAEKVTRAEFARRLGLTKLDVDDIFRGEVRITLDLLAHAAVALNRDVTVNLIEMDEEVVIEKSEPET